AAPRGRVPARQGDPARRRRGRGRGAGGVPHGLAEAGRAARGALVRTVVRPPETGTDPELDRALDALDLEHRLVVVLRYWQDLAVDDIAARVGVPSGTVKSRLHRSLRALR